MVGAGNTQSCARSLADNIGTDTITNQLISILDYWLSQGACINCSYDHLLHAAN